MVAKQSARKPIQLAEADPEGVTKMHPSTSARDVTPLTRTLGLPAF